MTLPDPSTIVPASLPSVPLKNRRLLPRHAAIYFVLGPDNALLYVGRSIALKQRWFSHHALSKLTAAGEVRIAWLEVKDSEFLSDLEVLCIKHFQPEMNRETTFRKRAKEREGIKAGELRINRLDDKTHRAAKMLAAHQGVSLNKFVLDAIELHCTRVALKTGLSEQILKLGNGKGEGKGK